MSHKSYDVWMTVGPKVEFHDRPVSWSSSFSTVQFQIVLFHGHPISRPSSLRPSSFMIVHFHDHLWESCFRSSSFTAVQFNNRPVLWPSSLITVHFHGQSSIKPFQVLFWAIVPLCKLWKCVLVFQTLKDSKS